jgi:hypothetical protein
MNINNETQALLSNVIVKVVPYLNEKQKRLFLGIIASEIGHGGIAFVNTVSGTARQTIINGAVEAGSESSQDKSDDQKKSKRIRKPGAGRKQLTEKYPDLHEKIQSLIDKDTYGNPENPLVWTTWSVRKIAEQLLVCFGYDIHFTSIGKELDAMGYSRQQNQKMCQIGEQHPDRDAQFRYINETAEQFLEATDPVISIDTKKKENIGNFKNNGSEYRPKGEPRRVLDHDFPLPELGKVAPYGIYVLNNNTGFINLGLSHDTPEFAGESVRVWWNAIGKNTFPDAKRIYVTCDNGGSNESRIWLFKRYLQDISNETGLEIHVSHFPPGTSKWNKIEHRLFCYISKNWQGQPLINVETVVNLISSTTTKTGLEVVCKVDPNTYETGLKISKEEKEKINITFVGPNEKWNYIIRPNE